MGYSEYDIESYKLLDQAHKTWVKKEFIKQTGIVVANKTVQRYFNELWSIPGQYCEMMIPIIAQAVEMQIASNTARIAQLKAETERLIGLNILLTVKYNHYESSL